MSIDKEISFENPSQEGRVYYQDIMYKGKNIGAAIMEKGGRIAPIKEWFQCFSRSGLRAKSCINHGGEVIPDPERRGFYARFGTLESFIKYWGEK